ncbi:LacI family DNA-binding transcriptional regulator [Phycisphaerales bacterium AB-hyl4]|uniref:LacI family DNA-binding transcriptional regulator n=1 Tax=Natronomicrosphaera hydrolytica TaxID=3242702 RepID=A0ABV4U4H3_9BACT
MGYCIPVRIQDVAKLAGVSPATVSRVFSHHPNIRDEVRSRVVSVAKAHGYQPRLSPKQRNVVLILPSDQIYPIRNCLEMVMLALTSELPRRGLRIEVLPHDNLDRLDSIQFCAAVAIGAEPNEFETWPGRFSLPLVMVDRQAPAGCRNVYCVRSDEMQGMDLAIEHLHQRGCRKVGSIIYGKPGVGNTDARRQGIIQALEKRDLPAHDALIHLSADDNYVEIIGKLLQQDIDALFCPGGNAGIVTAYALSLFGKQVPEEISVIASEHLQFSRYATPSQTSIMQDHKALAKTVANIIESHLNNTVSDREFVLPYQLIARDSVKY